MKRFIAKLRTGSFSRDDDGSIIVFVCMVFSAMFLVGGTAIDLARHENLRASLQYNLDRAVLAAASLKQSKDPEEVVLDYMSKVNTTAEFTVSVDSTVAVNARSVSASATTTLDTWFLSMAGIDDMPITANSRAEERIPQLEISLILDVSGSMTGTKLANLKIAAKQFVTTMLANTDPQTVSISIVPFNHNVSPSDDIVNNLTIDVTHNLSSCLEFADADFQQTGIDPTVAQTQAVFTALYGSFNNFSSGYETCFPSAAFEIMPYSDNETSLHNKIDGLRADGWTAAHMGMKWGLALLDPMFQSVATAMIVDGKVHSGFNGIPAAYTENETMKIAILMGDGANTYEFRFEDNKYKGNQSGLWEVVSLEPGEFEYLTYYGRTYRGSSYERYCSGYSGVVCYYGDPQEKTNYFLNKPSNGKYFSITGNQWVSATDFNLIKAVAAAIDSGDGSGLLATVTGMVIGGVTLTEIRDIANPSWAEAWGKMPASYYDSITGEDAFNDLVYDGSRQMAEADAMLADACQAAYDKNIVVYTIGFETNSTTSGKLKDCASSVSHFYPASTTNISEVFASIASSIQKLKLTQ